MATSAPSVSEPFLPDVPRERRRRCLWGAVFWAVVFAWLWLGATPLARVLGPAWAVLGFASPVGYIFSLALALPWFGNGPGAVGGGLLYLWDMGMMGLVVGHLARRARGVVARRESRLDPWVTLFVGCAWVALIPQLRWLRCELLFEKLQFMRTIYTHAANAGVFGLRMALDLTLAAGFYVALRDRPWPPPRQLAMLRLLLAALTFTALVGLLHYAGLLSLAWWRQDIAYSLRFGDRRLGSLFWDPGWMAEYLAPLAPAALAFAWMARRGAARAGWIALAALLGLSQLLTLQRAGWLALTAAYAVVAFAATSLEQGSAARARLRPLIRAAMVLCLVIALGAVLALLVPDFRHRAARLIFYPDRTEIWQRAWTLIRMAPLSGVGIGDYAHEYIMFFPDDAYGHLLMTAHNQYLHLWAERGLFGLGIFLTIVGLMGGGLWRAIRSGRTDTADAAARAGQLVRLALLGGLVAFLVDGLFQYNFYVRAIETLFWLLAGWSTWVTPPGVRPGAPARRWPRWVIPLAIAIMACSMVWENRWRLAPWRFGMAAGVNFHVAGKTARLAIPAGARRIQLTVASIDPARRQYPVTYTVKLGEAMLATATLQTSPTQTLQIELPATRPPGAKLDLAVSRSWSPWGYGLGQALPIMELGVMYLDPVVE